jgi:hypothetical protein
MTAAFLPVAAAGRALIMRNLHEGEAAGLGQRSPVLHRADAMPGHETVARGAVSHLWCLEKPVEMHVP